jgi:hypothetical protein
VPPELIPDPDNVSRHLYSPFMGETGGDLVWDNVFMFPSKDGNCESVVWRKYAPELQDVHKLGCDKQRRDREAGKNSTYFGALTAQVGAIREIRSKTGARFRVEHVPEPLHHAHISYQHDAPLTKPDKTELKKLIRDTFAERSEDRCS